MTTNPFANMSFLGKLGATLQNTADPQYMERVRLQQAREQEIAAQKAFQDAQTALGQQRIDLSRDEIEMARQARMEEGIRTQRQQSALGKLSALAAQTGGVLPPEAVQEYLTSGGSATALGQLQKTFTPREEEITQVYDPSTGGMVYVPRSQALGRLASMPQERERRIIEQNDVQYYADTGEPVIPSANIPAPSIADNLTEGEKSTDKAFAKEYIGLQATGGLADIDKQLVQLEEAAANLESGRNLTGPNIAMQSDALLSLTNPEAIATRESVEEVVQRNLRLVLGSQFTEKEGERLIKRAYNERLSEAENAKRVRRLSAQIKSAAESKRSAIDYFEQNGTLKGWRGSLPSINDFDPTAKTASEMTDAELEAIANGN
jgi:hypothetical protein